MVDQAIRELLDRIQGATDVSDYDRAEWHAQELVDFLNKYNNSDDSPEAGIDDHFRGSYNTESDEE